MPTFPPSPTAATRNTSSVPTGPTLVFSARVAGRQEAWSTNFDIYEVSSNGVGTPRNLTADNPAWDTQPVYLRNGDLAWLAMSRPGFEADRFRIKVTHDGAVRDVAAQWDRSVQHLAVARDGQTLLATASDLGQTPLFAVNVASGAVTPAFGPGYRRRLLARAARQRRPVARPRLASRSLSTAREGRTAQTHERKRRAPRARARSASSSSSASRAGTTRRCTATW